MQNLALSKRPDKIDFKSPITLTKDKSFKVEQNEKASKDFSAMFLKFFFSKIIPESDGGYFGSDTCGDIYKSLWVDAVADQMAEQDILGLSRYALDHLNKEDQKVPSQKQFSGDEQTFLPFHFPSLPTAYASHPLPTGAFYDNTL